MISAILQACEQYGSCSGFDSRSQAKQKSWKQSIVDIVEEERLKRTLVVDLWLEFILTL